MLTLWNTASRRQEPVTPIEGGVIRMYACGPTVYQRAHIGNLRAYVLEDVLRRVLEFQGYTVKHVMNITDVGHLVGDGDEGQDKMMKSATETGRTVWDIAKAYTDAFISDIDMLWIERPTVMPRATEHIQEQIDVIRVLEEKGHTYRTSDGVYFDTASFSAYGRFSGQKLEEKEEGARVAVNTEKRHPSDFALWKFRYPNGRAFDPALDNPSLRHQMEWESPWGIGAPGWHIECSAMSRKELGQPFDIHAGGVDHIPVHHENEIAQSVAAFGVPLAHHWFHVDFLLVDGQKMSKSLGNVYTLDDLVARQIHPLSYRFFLLGAQYRQKQNFTWEAVQASQQALARLIDEVRAWDAPTSADVAVLAEFSAALDDDVNMARALSVVWKMVDADLATSVKAATLLEMDRVLGLGLERVIAKPIEVPEEIQQQLEKRAQYRAEKRWADSDAVRDELLAAGWKVEDGPSGQRVVPTAISFS